MVPRACNTRFLKIVFARYSTFKHFAYAQSAMKSFPRMLSQRLNHFLICSGCDKIIFPYAEHICTCKNSYHFFWLSICENSFGVCPVCDETVSLYSQCVRHRTRPEWGALGNPQELNWFPPLIKPLRRTRTLCDPAQTQVWSESSVVEHNLYFARLAIAG